MEVGVGKLIYSILLLGLLAQATADQKAISIYERYYYDEIEGKWFYTLPDPNHRYPEKRNSSISCPLHSHFVLRVVGFGGNEVGECKCEKEFNNSPDRRHCIGTQSRGEPCGDDLVPCSTYAGLTCQNGACDCQPDAEWDDEDSLCYSDKICRSRDEGTFYDPNSSLKCAKGLNAPCKLETHNHGCPGNSSCLTYEGLFSPGFGFCQCNRGFTHDSEGKLCNRIRSRGDPCSETDTCGFSLFCLNNTVCECSDDSVWDSADADWMCKKVTGSPCPHWEECTRNAACKYESYTYDKKKCTCATGFKAMANGLCQAEHLGECSENVDCQPGFACIDGGCKCPAPISQIYKPNQESPGCLSLVDAPCNTSTTCVDNSHCSAGICTCDDGYTNTRTRECLKSHQARCSTKDKECNFHQGLACISHVCRCIDQELKFMPGMGCVGAAGSSCGDLNVVGGCRTEPCDKYFVSCELPAICNSNRQCEVRNPIRRIS